MVFKKGSNSLGGKAYLRIADKVIIDDFICRSPVAGMAEMYTNKLLNQRSLEQNLKANAML